MHLCGLVCDTKVRHMKHIELQEIILLLVLIKRDKGIDFQIPKREREREKEREREHNI